MGKGKMFRLPNVKRACGTYKVPLTVEEVMQLGCDELLELCKKPRTIDYPEFEKTPSVTLSDWFKRAAENVEDHQASESDPLTADQLEKLKKNTPSCISYLLKEKPEKSENFNFNRAAMLLANYYQDIGANYEQAFDTCNDFLSNYPYSETYSTPENRLKHFEYQWQYMLKNFGYFFSCERAQGLQMPAEAYRCIGCLQTGEAQIIEPQKPDDQLNFPYRVMTGAAGYFANVYGTVMEAPEHSIFMAYLTCLGAYFAPFLTVKSELRTQPRLYTVIVGESAWDRKSTLLNKVIFKFKKAYPDFNTCHGIGSAEGLQRVLKIEESNAPIIERVGTLLVFDELKTFVSKCKIDNSVLLPIVNTLFEINLYETHTKNRDVLIENAYLSLLAATTKETYERIYSAAFIDIGFPNRIFLVPGHAERKFSIPQRISEEDEKIMHSYLIDLRNFVGSGIEFDFTQEAMNIYHDWYMSAENSVHSKRLETYSLRLMQLLTLNEKRRTIDTEIIQNAIALCDWQLEVRKIYDPIDADSKIAQMEQKIIRYLKKGPQGDRQLKINTNAYRAGLWFYKTAIGNLREAKEITWEKSSNSYRLV
jgi:hypothetical protein